MKKGLNATQLKLIAILAMVCDHVAWGFVEMFSLPGQIMHVIGRLTIPIMCFFIAEGYRKTHKLRGYIYRMMIFAFASIIPFYLFFGEEYGYRQNIIFDYLLALLTLTVVDSKKFSKPVKVLLAGLLIIVSAVIGGWPVLPILFVLVFYYGKSFKQKAFWVCFLTCFVETFVIIMILLNNVYHFSSYDWKWYQWLYFLGFMLALPLLSLYNGEKSGERLHIPKMFFYFFYPVHFMVLYTIKQIPTGNFYTLYVLLHVICLVCALMLSVRLIYARPSRALVISVFLGLSCVMYILGFVIEIYSGGSADLAYGGVILEYFGECMVFMVFLLFMSEICRKKVPTYLYLLATFFSLTIVTLVATTRENKIFYTYVGIDSTGPFPRIDLEYGWGFYLFILYMIGVCGGSLYIGLSSLPKLQGIEKKRVSLILIAIFCPWIAFLLKLIGLTGGYEVSALGVLGSLFFIYRSIISYGYFDSMQLAGENALHHFGDGVLVYDNNQEIVYVNKSMKELFPEVKRHNRIEDFDYMKAFVEKGTSSFAKNNLIYDVTVVPLEEHGSPQGFMLTAKDMTEHYEHLREAERFAHTDALTGLSNRLFFKQCFDEFLQTGGLGCMLMFDLDNFKGVNDTYGHSTGDKVLITLAETILNAAHNEHISCRIGGDEFCMFLKNVTDKDEVGRICTDMIKDFPERLIAAGVGAITSISIGAAILNSLSSDPDIDEFKRIYNAADSALYIAKNSGKGIYKINEKQA